MKIKSNIGFSAPLIRECFKMYWYLPVLSFVLYFFAGIVPILSNMNSAEIIEGYVDRCMNNSSTVYILLLCIVPITAANLMMSFLHMESKALMLHALPFSKSRIFNSYYISGFLICQIPVCITAVLYMIIVPRIELLSSGDVLMWWLSSAAIATFFFSVAILAGTLTGTTSMSLIAAGVLLVTIPGIVYVTDAYCVIFISGYSKMPPDILDIARKSNPIFAIMTDGDVLAVKQCVIYIACAIVISILAKAVYRTRKLERVGSSSLSQLFEELITYICVFGGMSLFGLLVWNFSNSKLLVVTGMIVGTLFSFLLVKVILNRSIKIFSRGLIRSMAIYLCIAVMFIALILFDIFGFAKRVPEREDIDAVEMGSLIAGYSTVANFDLSDKYVKEKPYLTSDESIELVRELHRYIVEEDAAIIDYDGKIEDVYGTGLSVTDAYGNETLINNEIINVEYLLKNGNELIRSYDVRMDDEIAGLIEEILSCREYREKDRVASFIREDKISYMQITGLLEEMDIGYENSAEFAQNDYEKYMINSGSKAIIENPQVIKAIIDAWDADNESDGFMEKNKTCSDGEELAMIEIFFGKGEDTESIFFYVSDLDAKTINCLIENGYGATIGRSPQ